jgi:hypothetical protein
LKTSARAKAAGAGVQALRSDLAKNLRPTPAKDQKGEYKFHLATLEGLSVCLMQCACSLFSKQKLFKQYIIKYTMLRSHAQIK